jgi:hypothetical protein
LIPAAWAGEPGAVILDRALPLQLLSHVRFDERTWVIQPIPKRERHLALSSQDRNKQKDEKYQNPRGRRFDIHLNK